MRNGRAPSAGETAAGGAGPAAQGVADPRGWQSARLRRVTSTRCTCQPGPVGGDRRPLRRSRSNLAQNATPRIPAAQRRAVDQACWDDPQRERPRGCGPPPRIHPVEARARSRPTFSPSPFRRRPQARYGDQHDHQKSAPKRDRKVATSRAQAGKMSSTVDPPLQMRRPASASKLRRRGRPVNPDRADAGGRRRVDQSGGREWHGVATQATRHPPTSAHWPGPPDKLVAAKSHRSSTSRPKSKSWLPQRRRNRSPAQGSIAAINRVNVPARHLAPTARHRQVAPLAACPPLSVNNSVFGAFRPRLFDQSAGPTHGEADGNRRGCREK